MSETIHDGTSVEVPSSTYETVVPSGASPVVGTTSDGQTLYRHPDGTVSTAIPGGGIPYDATGRPAVVVGRDTPSSGARFDLNNPPEGWTVAAVPNIATLTIEYHVSSVAGDYFRTADKDAIGGHVADIEKAKRTVQPQQNAITQQSIGAFGQAFGQS